MRLVDSKFWSKTAFSKNCLHGVRLLRREEMRARWSDNDRNFGPFTYANQKTNHFTLVLVSGDGEDYPGCSLRLQLFKATFIVALPAVIKPYREKVEAGWDGPTIVLMGRSWYWKHEAREYGFSCSDGYLQVYYGRQSHFGDSKVEQRKSWILPWTEWSHVRHSLYGLDGEHFVDEPKKVHHVLAGATAMSVSYQDWKKTQDLCPSRSFAFADFDGEHLTVKTRIEEREWHSGTGWFKWLRFFRKPKIHRSLDLDFSGEVGPRKGSWKGGTIGHAIEMLPGELHESAFRRYCEGEDHRGGKPRNMKFIGAA